MIESEKLEKEARLRQYLKVRDDPYEFLKAVFTRDPADIKTPVKRFPYEREYVQWYVECWKREKAICIPKSRRMIMSWMNIALNLWDALFHQHREIAFVSKKEDDSDELVERAQFIYDHLDTKVVPKELLPRKIRTFCSLVFPETGSHIRGFPSGANQLRQYGFSRILGDECAFWPDAEEMYTGAKPTLDGGGQIVLVSSLYPGFFMRAVFDQFGNTQDFTPESVQISKKIQPMRGVTLWRNPKNKFFIFELHYSADPEKDAEWIAEHKPHIPIREWNREYELAWEIYDGLPVYGDWDKTKHINNHVQPEVGLPLLRGWDFGLTPSCVIAQLQGSKLVVFQEFCESNMGVQRFSDIVIPSCNHMFPAWMKGSSTSWIDFMDPAGVQRDQSNEGSCALVLDSQGLNPIPGDIAFEKRKARIEHFLISFDKDGPNFQINALQCPKLVKGFNGGYHYPETAMVKEPRSLRPVKNEYSHPHDALQYVATIKDFAKRRFANAGVPRLSYSSRKETYVREQ